MRNWIAGAMTVLGTLLILSGAAIIVLRAWPRADAATAEEPAATTPSFLSSADRGARALFRLGPPERLLGWGTLLLLLAAFTAGAFGFELGANVPAK